MRLIIFLLSLTFFFAPLIHAEQTGDVHLYCKPKVRVYLDGEFIGKTNKSDSGIFIKDVSLGQHKIRLVKKRKANEVLTFSVNRALTEIESNKYNVGKFTEDVRNSRLISEQTGMKKVRGAQMNMDGLPSGVELYVNVKTEISDLYIPGFDEKYEVDTLPKLSFMAIPPHQIRDISLSVENDKVLVKGLIDPKGIVDSVVIIVSCGNESFDSLAYSVALDTRFKPAVKNNRKTWVWDSWSIPYTKPVGEESLSKEVSSTQNKSFIINSSEEYLPSPDEFVPVEVQPEMIKEKRPDYPIKARDNGIEGIVLMKVLVGKKGDVLKSQVAKSSGNEQLDAAALKAASKYKFKPALQNGMPIACWTIYRVSFNLDK